MIVMGFKKSPLDRGHLFAWQNVAIFCLHLFHTHPQCRQGFTCGFQYLLALLDRQRSRRFDADRFRVVERSGNQHPLAEHPAGDTVARFIVDKLD